MSMSIHTDVGPALALAAAAAAAAAGEPRPYIQPPLHATPSPTRLRHAPHAVGVPFVRQEPKQLKALVVPRRRPAIQHAACHVAPWNRYPHHQQPVVGRVAAVAGARHQRVLHPAISKSATATAAAAAAATAAAAGCAASGEPVHASGRAVHELRSRARARVRVCGRGCACACA
eukprot:364692-Chlamydomonas_euryale.AAC.17